MNSIWRLSVGGWRGTGASGSVFRSRRQLPPDSREPAGFAPFGVQTDSSGVRNGRQRVHSLVRRERRPGAIPGQFFFAALVMERTSALRRSISPAMESCSSIFRRRNAAVTLIFSSIPFFVRMYA